MSRHSPLIDSGTLDPVEAVRDWQMRALFTDLKVRPKASSHAIDVVPRSSCGANYPAWQTELIEID